MLYEVITLIFGLDMASLFDWPRGLLEQVGGNSDRVLQQLEQRVANPVESLLALYRRQERIAALEGQLSRAAVDHNELYQLRGKVALLESQVSRTQPGMKALMVSEIYTKGEVMVLGVGEVDGVVKGLAITDGDGLLVGRVGSVGRYISRIERVGEPGFKIPAQTVGGGAKGVVFSKGNEVIRITSYNVCYTKLLRLPRFREAVMPVFTDLYKSVTEGEETRIVLVNGLVN